MHYRVICRCSSLTIYKSNCVDLLCVSFSLIDNATSKLIFSSQSRNCAFHIWFLPFYQSRSSLDRAVQNCPLISPQLVTWSFVAMVVHLRHQHFIDLPNSILDRLPFTQCRATSLSNYTEHFWTRNFRKKTTLLVGWLLFVRDKS